MKTVDKMEVLHSQSAEFIEKGETGKFLKLIPDTFIIKGEEKDGVFNQGYALRHINRQDILLIDVVEESSKKAVKKLVEDGYKIKGILITCNGILKDAYGDLETISKNAGDAPIFVHPRHNFKDNFKTKDILERKGTLKDFGLKVFELPGNGGASVIIHSEINDGMLFPGEDAEGSAYNSSLNTFKRPKMERSNDDYGLAESWSAFREEFTYLFPRKGKPGFNIEEGQERDILNALSHN